MFSSLNLKKYKNINILIPVLPLIIIIIFAICHYDKVKLVADRSGDLFLKADYIKLCFLMLFNITLSFYILKKSSEGRLPLYKSFMFSAFFLGIGYMFVFQGLSAPDEVSHYISAYKLSSQFMGLEPVIEDGHVKVREQDYFLEDLSDIAGTRDGLNNTQENKTDAGDDIDKVKASNKETDSDTYSTDEMEILGRNIEEKDLKIIKNWDRLYPYKNSKNIRISSQPPVKTTPLVYIPQAFGICIARIMGFNSITMINLGKFFNLLFYVLVMSYALSLMPFAKEILYGVAVLPMSLHLAASMSYDAMLLSIISCFFAKILNMAYAYDKSPDEEKKISGISACNTVNSENGNNEKKIDSTCMGYRPGIKDILFLCLLTAIYAPCKLIYSPAVFAYFIINRNRFKNKKIYLLGFVAILTTLIISIFAVNAVLIQSYAQARTSSVGWAGEPGFTIRELAHRPFFTMDMIYKTILLQLDYYHMTMIGAYLGNINRVLNVPYICIVFFSLGLIMLGLRVKEQNTDMVRGFKERFIIAFIVFAVFSGAILSMFIAWTPRGAMVISGVQGRYFLPVLMPLLLLADKLPVEAVRDIKKPVLFTFICLNSYALIRLFAIICMRIDLT